MVKRSSLRGRWFRNTLVVFCVLGFVVALAITMTFAFYYYSNMRSDLSARAEQTRLFFTNYIGQTYDDYYRACEEYTQEFEMSGSLELQFINKDGKLVSSSYGNWAGTSPTTSEITKAMQTLDIESFVGISPDTGEHIMAMSCPLLYKNGEPTGMVLRYVTSTRLLNLQILYIGLVAVGIFLLLLIVLLLSSSYYIRSILVPVEEIAEKAKRIANGSYGIQIEKKYNDEIGGLADTINEMSIKISQNEKMQAEFISSLSHELRTPLTAINGWSETLLSGDDLDEQTRRGVKIISREAKRLTEMVVELLDFTRLQDGRFTLNVEMADIRSEFEDTVYMYSSRLTQEGITLHYEENDQDVPQIPCDAKRMRQVFLNILDNAAKHGGEGKRIEASMEFDDQQMIVRIRDFGPGIADDELPLVKKKFYKGHSKARGTGIGLAVCDEIVTMHGGRLTLENAAGGGTLVTVYLPTAQ